VDLDAIRPQEDEERTANPYRRELDIEPEQKVLLYSGSMNRKQGLDLLTEVIGRLSPRRDLVWLLAGEGPSKEELAKACAGLDQVRLLPLQPLERLNDWLNLADIHLLPQKASAADLVLPSKLLGMLASGRPVVSGSPPGSALATLVREAGICVAPEDPAAFAVAVQTLADDPHLRIQKGQQARALAERCFGREAVLRTFEREALALKQR
jgi:colanic acid biosynthesis glycosyl transferase WcaI